LSDVEEREDAQQLRDVRRLDTLLRPSSIQTLQALVAEAHDRLRSVSCIVTRYKGVWRLQGVRINQGRRCSLLSLSTSPIRRRARRIGLSQGSYEFAERWIELGESCVAADDVSALDVARMPCLHGSPRVTSEPRRRSVCKRPEGPHGRRRGSAALARSVSVTCRSELKLCLAKDGASGVRSEHRKKYRTYISQPMNQGLTRLREELAD
jgi:hypothetical protein